MTTKKCSVCKQEKNLENFSKHKCAKDGLHSDCKACASEYRKMNREKRRLYNLDYVSKNKEKVQQAKIIYREKNKELLKLKSKIYNSKPEVVEKNKKRASEYEKTDKAKLRRAKYREENKELYCQATKRYNLKNKEALIQKHRDRMANEPLYRLKRKIRDAIKNSLAKKGYSKNGRTQEILGCDYDFFIQYIEAQFTEGMNWANATIDHIKPLKTAKTEEDVVTLNHYTNLQPLFSPDNSKKHAKLITKQLRLI